MKQIILSAITWHIQDNQDIRPSQHRFRKGRPCLTNLISSYDQVTQLLDEGKAVDLAYLDFSKDFNPVFHSILLEELIDDGLDSLQWILDKQDLLKERQKDLKFLTEEEYWKLQIFFTNVIQALGEHLKLRQQVIATATVYFKRFYARYSLKSIDPVLMAPTCVFLASKVEEFGVVSNTRLISAATSVLKTRFSYAFPKEFPYRMNHILECEFYLLELMDCCLIVYHPYRPLLQYVQDMGQEDMLLPLAWRIVNDTYRTDLCLLYPPFMIALACLHVACVVQQKDARQWFAELSVDMEKILEIIRVILKLYEQWKNFDERKEMATILSKMPKPKPPPNSEGEQGPNGSQNSSYSQS
ncbi:hypothetical protein HGM15179_005395 [Zosterops borbonicus]|uniref:Cyclin-C n=1 Tax=Zosterops borbonicus TaxID=364589 RepID=A0A8K1GME9_9PASS|nr:hypothetical protein HGM15179_005395 [Zosterops borbonicus]